jgi:cytochrome c551
MDGEDAEMAGRRGWPAALLLAAGLAFMLAACGGGGGADDGRQGGGGGANRARAEGERLYASRCAACHGGELEGGFGLELKGIGGRMGRDELIAVIRDGTGLMPALKDRLSEEEIAAIVDWIREQ